MVLNGALWTTLAQIPIPGGDQLVAISEQGVAVILALDLLLLGLGALAALWFLDKRQARQAEHEEAKRQAEAENDAAGENQILELAKALTVIVNADSARTAAIERQSENIARQTSAIEQLAKATTEQSQFVSKLLEHQLNYAAEHERIARAVAAESVDTVLKELGDVRRMLVGKELLRRFDEAMAEMTGVKRLIEGRLVLTLPQPPVGIEAEPAPAVEPPAKPEATTNE